MSKATGVPPSRDDIVAILKAHRDLGPEYDQHLADQIVDLVRKTPTETPAKPTRRGGFRHLGGIFALSIPLIAIAGGEAHTVGVLGVVALDIVAMVLAIIFG